MEVSFFRRNTVAGSSHISTVSVVAMHRNAGGQLRRAAPGGSGADGRLVAGEGDVARQSGRGR